MGVTHILNVTSKEYTKRNKYFKYLDIPIYDQHNEDSKKHYRITNRFIDEGRKEGKVLVQSVQGKSRAPTFIMAYLIAKEKIKLKDGLNMLR
jgi:protein-tyrosine phosphatase